MPQICHYAKYKTKLNLCLLSCFDFAPTCLTLYTLCNISRTCHIHIYTQNLFALCHSLIHHSKSTTYQQQQQQHQWNISSKRNKSSKGRCCDGKGQQCHFAHHQQHQPNQVSNTYESQFQTTQGIPYIEDPVDRYEATSPADNGLKGMRQDVATDPSADVCVRLTEKNETATTACGSGGGGGPIAVVSAPTTVLSAGTAGGDVPKPSPCHMAHAVQPTSPCITTKRRNIFSCCNRRRNKRRPSLTVGFNNSQHLMSTTEGKMCCNQQVIILYVLQYL